MSADRLSASGAVNLESESQETSVTQGNTTIRTFVSSKARLLSQRAYEIGQGASTTKLESQADGNYKLTATYSFDVVSGSNAEKPASTHELENNISQVDVWTNPVLRATFLSAFGSTAAANLGIGYVNRAVEAFKAANDGSAAAITAAMNKIDVDYPPGTYATINALIKNAFRGVALRQVTNTLQFDTVYRRRITAATYNQVQAAFTGASKIWTTAEVVAFEGTPAAWWFQLPTGYLWLKAPPTVNTVSMQKTEICYNYISFVEAWGLTFQAYNSATLLNF